VLADPGIPGASASRSQMVVIDSMMHQFSSLVLKSIVVPVDPIGKDEIEQWRTDWNIDPAVQIDGADAVGLRKSYSQTTAPLLLVSPSGQIVASWHFPTAPADVWLQIQSHVGAPAGAQQMPSCRNPAEVR